MLTQKFSMPPVLETENRFLRKTYAIIDEMMNDRQFGASCLAQKNAMSLRTLNRKLNALTGLTAGELIRQYRLQKSLTLLRADYNVSETAYMVGFDTPAYFSQCFKMQFGVPPKNHNSLVIADVISASRP